jgi:KDO2-lipid IV(A) lauroyltransferase
MSADDLFSRVRIDGIERITDCLNSGTGLILALPRMGNVELVARWLAENVAPFTTVSAQYKSMAMNQILSHARSSFSMEIVHAGPHQIAHKMRGSRLNFYTLSERLRAGGLVCLIGDSDPTGNGLDVEFFQHRVRFPAGPATLSIHTGAPIITAAVWRGDGIYMGKLYEELPIPCENSRTRNIKALTQAMATAFEEPIRNHPDDWHHFNRLVQ